MTNAAPEGATPPTTGTPESASEVNTGGAGNTDLTGQAREVVESSEDGATGPTPGGG